MTKIQKQISLTAVRLAIKQQADPVRAEHSKRFFKTGKGEYGHGDVFLGLTVPAQRQIAKEFRDLPLANVFKLLQSKIHEERLTALIMLVEKYRKGDENVKKDIFRRYLGMSRWINNWDLVDTSAPQIVGDFCVRQKDYKILRQLVGSKDLWERRIGIVSTMALMKAGEVDLTLELSERLLNDPHDLIHKATGWMLRIAGDTAPKKTETFLEKHAGRMPRTMLRYAIEHWPEKKRKKILMKKKNATQEPLTRNDDF